MTDSHSIRIRQQERRESVCRAHENNIVWCSSEAEECFDDCTTLLSEVAVLEAQCAAMADAAKTVVYLHGHRHDCPGRHTPSVCSCGTTDLEQALSNLPARSAAMRKVVEAAIPVASEFAQQHPLIKRLREALALLLPLGRGWKEP
jgi:hypothetical protein